MAVMARETWTDERLDDLKDHMDEGFREVKGEIKLLRSEIGSLRSEGNGATRSLRSELKEEIAATRTELKGEIAATRTELKTDIGKLDAKFDRLTFTLIAALIGLLATHYLG
jgi:chromosome segregation ATPase